MKSWKHGTTRSCPVSMMTNFHRVLVIWSQRKTESCKKFSDLIQEETYMYSTTGSSTTSPSQFQTLVEAADLPCRWSPSLVRPSWPPASSSSSAINRNLNRVIRNTWMNGNSNCNRWTTKDAISLNFLHLPTSPNPVWPSSLSITTISKTAKKMQTAAHNLVK